MGENRKKNVYIMRKPLKIRGLRKYKTILRNSLTVKRLGAAPIFSISNDFFCDTSLISSIVTGLCHTEVKS
jgi:hypothetical protein